MDTVGVMIAGAGDHHPDGVHEMALGIVAHLRAERVMAQPAHETGERVGGAGSGRNREGLGGRHGMLQSTQMLGSIFQAYTISLTSASTATTPSGAGRTISGLISASRTTGRSITASRDRATIA